MLYEVAIVLRPTVKEAKDGGGEALLLPPTPVLADSHDAAIVAATHKLDIDLDIISFNCLQVLVRPFA